MLANAFTYAKRTRPGGARSRIGGEPRTWRPFRQAMGRYGIHVPDRQLACVPVRSPEGQAYLAAMAAAANYGQANRQLLTEATRRVFEQETATSLDLLYDVSHNLAKIEVHEVHGRERTLCVHRKGATRSLPPHHPDLPADLAAVGQPVLIPGTMGTASCVLAGVPDNPAFFSTGSRRRPAGCRAVTRPRATPTLTRSAEASRNPASSSAAAPPGDSPRKNPGPTRTSTPSSRQATKQGWRARWRALCPWEW